MLLAFAAFFVVPLIWAILAPTRTSSELVTGEPLAVGTLHNVWAAWHQLDGFDDQIYRRWLGNSLVYR